MESHPRNHYSSGKVTSKSCELHQHQWSLAFTGPSRNLQNTSKTLRKPWVEPSRGPSEPSRDRKVTQGSRKSDPETMESHPRNEYSSEKVISKSCERHQHQWSFAFTGPSQNLYNTSKTLRKPWVEPSRGPNEPSRDRKVTQGSGKDDPETMKKSSPE